MREIKFRAISKRTGQFVYGDLMTKDVHHGFAIVEGSSVIHPIKPETIGQFVTNTTDGEGDVYQGDVVEFHYFYNAGGSELESIVRGEVVYRDHYDHSGGLIGCFSLKLNSITDFNKITGEDYCEEDSYPVPFCMLFSHDTSFKIIGNIYQNPELK